MSINHTRCDSPENITYPVVILYNNKLNGNDDWYFQGHLEHYCPDLIDKCVYSAKSSLHVNSAVWMLHSATDARHNITSTTSTFRHAHQKWALVVRGSVQRVFKDPDILRSFEGRFDITMSYNKLSDVRWAYGHCWVLPIKRPQFKRPQIHDDEERVTAAWWPRVCRGRGVRYVLDLAEYLDIHVYGNCPFATHTCSSNLKRCRRRISADYKFVLAFQEDLCTQFIHDNLFRPLYEQWGVVPVVMGVADYAAVLPPNSYIDARNFPDAKSLADHLLNVGAHALLRHAYFSWRESYACSAPEPPGCSMCRFAVADLGSELSSSSYSSRNLTTFFQASSQCTSVDLFFSQFTNSSLFQPYILPKRFKMTSRYQNAYNYVMPNGDIILCIIVVGMGMCLVYKILQVCRYVLAYFIAEFRLY